MLVDQLQTDTATTLQDAEELLNKLPPLSPDHESVRGVVVKLRRAQHDSQSRSVWTKRTMIQSRKTIENARTLVDSVGTRVRTRDQSATKVRASSNQAGSASPTKSPTTGAMPIFLDLDTVLLDTHQGKYGPELTIQADLPEALARLAELSARVIIVANPKPRDAGHHMDTQHRLEVLRSGLAGSADDLLIVTCAHGESGECACAKPGNGLIKSTLKEHGLDPHSGWYVGADQEGMVTGRTAGLNTIRIGPHGADHLSDVHRPDYEARDLMDAANRILLETLAAD